MATDRWKGIKVPTQAGVLGTRLVPRHNENCDFNILRAKTAEGRFALLIELPPSAPNVAFPHFEAIEIQRWSSSEGNSSILITLLDDEVADLFSNLCDDIIDASKNATGDAMPQHLKRRLEKWRYLLRRGEGMSVEQERGLFAELLLLRRLIPTVGAYTAVTHWSGPQRAPRDFSFGSVFVEVKSNGGPQSPYVVISSENQLNSSAQERLFLFVVGLGSGATDGLSIDDLVGEISRAIGPDVVALEEFELRLAAAGYGASQDHGTYDCLGTAFYEVDENFPRLTPSQLPSGVMRVKYAVDLSYCDDCSVDEPEVIAALGGVDGGRD